MKTLATAFAVVLALPLFAEESAEEAFGKALEKETSDRDPAAAMEIYRRIVDRHRAEEEVAAKAQFRIGECYEKLGKFDEARAAYEALLKEFPAQSGVVEKSRDRLAALAGSNKEDDSESERLRNKLDTTKIDLDFTDSTLGDICDFLSEFGKFGILIDPATDLAGKQTSFVVKDLVLKHVVRLLASSYNAEVVERHGVLVFTTPERAAMLEKRELLRAKQGADESEMKIERSLLAIKISINFTETPIQEVVSFVQEVTQLNFVVARDCPAATVTLKMEEIQLDKMLDLMGFTAGVEFSIEDGVVMVRAPKK